MVTNLFKGNRSTFGLRKKTQKKGKIEDSTSLETGMIFTACIGGSQGGRWEKIEGETSWLKWRVTIRGAG